jgi:hypothetical protein
MRAIALEEHFATPAHLDGPEHRLKEQAAEVGGRFVVLEGGSFLVHSIAFE